MSNKIREFLIVARTQETRARATIKYSLSPSKRFNTVKHVKQIQIVALQENLEQGLDFLKKIDSNFHLSGQKLFFDFKNPYKIVAFAEPERSGGEATFVQNYNFENWRRGRDSNPRPPNRRHTLSRRARSTTPAPLPTIIILTLNVRL